jgi:ribosomal protein L11 methyltransferase
MRVEETYVEVSVFGTNETEAALADFLFGEGALGLVTEAAPGDPPGVRIRASFAGVAPVATIVTRLTRYQRALAALGIAGTDARIEVREIPTEDWSRAWNAHFAPLAVGRRLVIAPPWERGLFPEHRHVIRIHPGMSFGTGHHATTRMCLEALETYIDAWRGSRGPRVLDIGTGTGILAIAAARLGASQVLALDTDPEACAAAARNLLANNIATRIRLISGGVEALAAGIRFDLILANLDTSALSSLLGTLRVRLMPRGRLVASGILVEDEKAVGETVAVSALRIVARHLDEEWLCLAMAAAES